MLSPGPVRTSRRRRRGSGNWSAGDESGGIVAEHVYAEPTLHPSVIPVSGEPATFASGQGYRKSNVRIMCYEYSALCSVSSNTRSGVIPPGYGALPIECEQDLCAPSVHRVIRRLSYRHSKG